MKSYKNNNAINFTRIPKKVKCESCSEEMVTSKYIVIGYVREEYFEVEIELTNIGWLNEGFKEIKIACAQELEDRKILKDMNENEIEMMRIITV